MSYAQKHGLDSQSYDLGAQIELDMHICDFAPKSSLWGPRSRIWMQKICDSGGRLSGLGVQSMVWEDQFQNLGIQIYDLGVHIYDLLAQIQWCGHSDSVIHHWDSQI